MLETALPSGEAVKALYTTAPGQYGLAERPLPEPSSDNVLVKVAAAGLCHTDVIIRDGVASHVIYPVIPGHEFSGIVAECGSNVHHLQPGDRVAVHSIVPCGACRSCRLGLTVLCERYDECGSKRDGGFAEYVCVPARCLYPISDHLTLEEAALTEPAANAHSVVRQARVRPGDRVVVIGPGPIGLLAVQFARLLHPSRLILVGTRPERLALGHRLGATHTVNMREAGAKERLDELLARKGADVVLECAGTKSSAELAIELAGVGGRVAIEGVMGVDETIEIRPHSLVNKGQTLVGVLGWLTEDYVHALEYLEAGLIDARPLITHRFPLERWELAFEMITRRKSEAIKVELQP
jgi:2-desacetyl-2-hydroxyethyl bacteriochlorophyllide A dehydrogenase